MTDVTTKVVTDEHSTLPTEGFVSQKQILGDKKKGIVGVIPISPSGWWNGIKDGRFPKPYKIGNRTVWNVVDVRELLHNIAKGKV